MNAGPAFVFWLQIFGSLALEASLIFLLASGLQRCAKTGVWRRTVWQVALLGLGLMAVLELTGVGRATAGWATDWLAPRWPQSVTGNSPAIRPAGESTQPSDPGAFQQPRSILREPDLISSRFRMIRLTPDATAQGHGAAGAAEAAEDQNARFGWWPGILWLAGFGFVMGRAGLSHFLFLVFRRRKQTSTDVALCERIRFLAELVGIRRRVRVTCLNQLTGPIAFGVFRPTIGLPEGFCNQFTPEQREAMLIHELAHLAGRDPLWYLLADLVTGLLWWHPLAWWSRRQFQIASETAADEASLLLENGPEDLAECLVELGRRLTLPRSFGWLGIEGNGFRSGLGRRVARLFELSGRSWRPANRLPGWLAKTVGPAVLAASGIAGAAWALPHQDGRDANTLAKSWEQSVAALALDTIRSSSEATAEETLKTANQISPDAIPGLIQDAKLFFEAGKLDQAEALFNEVLKLEPTNETARHYRNSIIVSQEKRKDWIVEVSKVMAAQSLQKNESTNTPLPEFQAILPTNQNRLDKTWRGADAPLAAPEKSTPASANSGLATNAVHNGAQISPKEGSSETVPSSEVANAKSLETPPLHTRVFHVDPNTFIQGLHGVTNFSFSTNGLGFGGQGGSLGAQQGGSSSYGGVTKPGDGSAVDPQGRRGAAQQGAGAGIHYLTRETAKDEDTFAVQKFFAAVGVTLDPPKSVFFNERHGMLMVRATLQDLDTIGIAIQMLNVSPPQVMIEARFCEISEDDFSSLGLDWVLGTVFRTNSFDGMSTGILTEPQFRAVLKALEQRVGVDLVRRPKITTLSARQAQIKLVDVQYIVTDLNLNQTSSGGGIGTAAGGLATGGGAIGSTIQPITEPVELGPVLDVVPYVSADGYTIQMTIIPTLKEFIGYDLETAQLFQAQAQSVGGMGAWNPLTTTTPLPQFQLRQVVTSAVVWDGQTVVLGGHLSEDITKTKDKVPFLSDLPLAGWLFQRESSVKTKKRLLIFVTPTLVDPAGNRLHSPDQMPPAAKGIPPQSPAPPKPDAGPGH